MLVDPADQHLYQQVVLGVVGLSQNASYALAVSAGQVALVDGPYVEKPLITTGAGDHFNSGFCLGKLIGLENAACVLTGATTSGYYVRHAQSPFIEDLANMLRNWPGKEV